MSEDSSQPGLALSTLANALRTQLAARGVLMEQASTPGGELRFLHPKGWHAAWKDDHVSVLHGIPPRGWLTVYPVPVRQPLHPAELVDAFLEEFVEPGTQGLELVKRRMLERVPEVACAQLRLQVGATECQGLILGRVALGQARVVSYWVDTALFRPGPIEDLLLVLLDGIDAPPSSRFAEQQATWTPVLPEQLFPASPVAQGAPFTSTLARFALRLAPDWTGQELMLEGTRGWVLVPPLTEDPPLVVVTGADLLAPLEEVIQQGIQQLQTGGTWEVELGAQELPAEALGGAFGLMQLHRGVAFAAPGRPLRLWSLGVTDGVSVLHLFALGEAEQLVGLLPELATMTRSLRVLPRQLDPDTMAQLIGIWRFLDPSDKDSETHEHVIQLRPDGSLARTARLVDGRRAVLERPDVHGLRDAPASARWDVADGLLTLYRSDTQRELYGIESLSETSAILGGIWWERLE